MQIFINLIPFHANLPISFHRAILATTTSRKIYETIYNGKTYLEINKEIEKRLDDSLEETIIHYLAIVPQENATSEHMLNTIRRLIDTHLHKIDDVATRSQFISALTDPQLYHDVTHLITQNGYTAKSPVTIIYEIARLLAEMGEFSQSLTVSIR